jgi:uncharacterized protein (TIGR03067 family)
MVLRVSFAAVLVLAVASSAAPLPFPKPRKKVAGDLVRAMQGLWEVKSRVSSKATMSVLSTQKFVRVQGNTWTFLRADHSVPSGPCDMTLDPKQTPVALDLSYPNTGRPTPARPSPYMVGRIEVDGDTMRFCYRLRTDRPESMTPKKTAEYVFTLQRVRRP